MPAHQIHAGLTADSRVHLRQQRGGNLNHRDAAHEDGGQKPGDIGENAAPNGDDNAGAIAALGDHLLGQRLDLGETFAHLAIREETEFLRLPSARASKIGP